MHKCILIATALVLVLLVFYLNSTGGEAQMKSGKAMTVTAQKTIFGKMPDGTAIELYTFTNAKGLVAKVMTYGATLSELPSSAAWCLPGADSEDRQGTPRQAGSCRQDRRRYSFESALSR